MQVNNYQQTPNFGMALRIKQDACADLPKASQKVLEELQKAGEELKDTVYYHLSIGKNLEPTIESCYANAYRPPFDICRVQGSKDAIALNTTWAGHEHGELKSGDSHTAYYTFKDDETVDDLVLNVTSKKSDIGKAVELVKALDAKSAYEAQVAAEKAAEQAERNKIANELIEKFGVDA